MNQEQTDPRISEKERRMCQDLACKIQVCLQNRGRNEKWCQDIIGDWERLCSPENSSKGEKAPTRPQGSTF